MSVDTEAAKAQQEQARIWTEELVPRLNELEKLAKTTATKAEGHGDLQTAIAKVNARLDELEQIGVVAAATKTTKHDAAELSTGFAEFVKAGKVDTSAGKLSMDTDTGGAVLAPVDFVARISEIQHDLVQMRQYCQVIPTSKYAIEVPKADDSDVAVWAEDDSSARTANTGPGLSLEKILAFEQYYRMFLGNNLLEDSAVPLESFIAARAARRFAQQEGEAFVTGNGVGKPEGIFNNAALIAAGMETDTATLEPEDIIDLYTSLAQVYAERGTFVLHRTYVGTIRKMRDGDGAFLWAPALGGTGLAGKNPSTILGRPYICSETSETVSSAATGDQIIAFGDLYEGYTIADRRVVSALRDPYSTGGAGIYMHMRTRVGGQVVQPAALKLLKKGS